MYRILFLILGILKKQGSFFNIHASEEEVSLFPKQMGAGKPIPCKIDFPT